MSMDLDELTAAAADTIAADHEVSARAMQVSVEAAGAILGARVEPDVDNLGGTSPYWVNFKTEFYVLVCTDDIKYKEVREQAKGADKVSKTVVIPAIAGAIGGGDWGCGWCTNTFRRLGDFGVSTDWQACVVQECGRPTGS